MTSESTLYTCPTCGNFIPINAINRGDDFGQCPECVQQGKVIKWPRVAVDSEQFGQSTRPERFRQMSAGYLKSAMILCNDLGEHQEQLDWPRASATQFCVYHAVELFLKACILTRAPSGEKLHHEVGKLQDRYCELFPEIKDEFHIETPWDISLDKVAEAFGVNLEIEAFENNTDQVYRYLGGKSDAEPKGCYVFAPGTCLFMCERLETEMARVWERIRKI